MLDHLPNVSGHVKQAQPVRRETLHRFQELPPLGKSAVAGVVEVGLARRSFAAPRVLRREIASPRGKLEFQHRWKTIDAALFPGAPTQVVRNVVPIDKDDRMTLGSGRSRARLPVQWRRMASGLDELRILGVGHRVRGDFKVVHALLAESPTLNQNELFRAECRKNYECRQ